MIDKDFEDEYNIETNKIKDDFLILKEIQNKLFEIIKLNEQLKSSFLQIDNESLVDLIENKKINFYFTIGQNTETSVCFDQKINISEKDVLDELKNEYEE